MAAPTTLRRGAFLPAWTPRLRPHEGEGFNVASALVGLLLALAAGGWLLARADAPREALAYGAYAATLALLFAATTLHHLFPRSVALLRLDHASIYLVMLGTGAPVCLLLAPAPWGAFALALLALLCGLGVAVKLRAPRMPAWRNLALYLPAPLPALAAVAPAAPALPAAALPLLGASLASFVGGALIDAAERPSPRGIGAHGLFHLLVLLGCALAFAFVVVATGA